MDLPFQKLSMPGADVWFAPALVPLNERARLFSQLRRQAAWKQQHITLAGRSIALPRLTAWHGDPGTAYAYSGIRNEPDPWISPLTDVRELLNFYVGTLFNSVLINLYRNGRDSVSWHADDEVELGVAPVIASVSLGASRKFSFKHRLDRSLRHDMMLEDGDVLVMRGNTQQTWLHQIPKTTLAVGERINLTFRSVHTKASPGRHPEEDV